MTTTNFSMNQTHPPVTQSARLHVAAAAQGLLDRPYKASSPIATVLNLLGAKWYTWFWFTFLFITKNAPFWGAAVTLFAIVHILENPASYPSWAIAVPCGIQLLLLAWNIPGHVLYINVTSKYIRGLELRLRAAMVRRLQQLSIGFHNQSESGRLQAKVLRDVESLEQMVRQLMQGGFEAVLSMMIALGVALYHRPLVALFYIIAAPAGALLIRSFRGRMRSTNHEFRDGVERVSSKVSEMIDMIPVTRAHGVEQVEIDAVDGHLADLSRRGRRLDRVQALFQSSTWVTLQAVRLAALTVFAIMVSEGYLVLAELVLFMAFFDQMVNSCMMLLGMVPVLAKGFESVNSLGEVLECPDLEANHGKRTVRDVSGAITFEQVGFTYDKRAKAALDGVDLTIRPGECVAFVGESGSGKSTCMNLVIGFYRPTAGRVLLDGVDMDDLDLRTFRRHLAVVPQQVLLFSGSLRENITYGLDDVSDEKVWEAIDAANLRGVIDQLEHGLDTTVGENGVQMSGGQRQRIAIARALIRDPAVIILDEATSALDVASEREVQLAIDRLVAGRTTLIVAHRLSTIRNADRVVVMDQGQIAEVGTQDELIKRGGAFAKLKALQS